MNPSRTERTPAAAPVLGVPPAGPAGVAVAAPNAVSADAGGRMAAEGGNAVDAAIAAVLVALVCEPGIASLAGGAFLTVAPGDGRTPVTVDGYVEMPGRGLPPEAFGRGLREVVVEYGGGTAMTVGHGSVAVPGTLVACELAHARFGSLPWRVVVEPAAEVARSGFVLGDAAAHYLAHAREPVFGWSAPTRAALHGPDGRPIGAGQTMVIPDLAEFLELLAERGSAALHGGDVAHALAAEMADHGGLVTVEDLARYRAIVRPALAVAVGAWELFTNPPPSIGGPVLAAMLHLLDGRPRGPWTAADLRHLVDVQLAVLRYRADHLDLAPDRTAAAQALLDRVAGGGQAWRRAAPSTLHVSAVDADGAACAITASSGYGSGVTAPGTGVWLNNCLGEHELNRGGPHALAPGRRLASNMAPTVGVREDGAVLAAGSPGADRITTALAQTLALLAHGGLGVQDAVDAPRLHVRVGADSATQSVLVPPHSIFS